MQTTLPTSQARTDEAAGIEAEIDYQNSIHNLRTVLAVMSA